MKNRSTSKVTRSNTSLSIMKMRKKVGNLLDLLIMNLILPWTRLIVLKDLLKKHQNMLLLSKSIKKVMIFRTFWTQSNYKCNLPLRNKTNMSNYHLLKLTELSYQHKKGILLNLFVLSLNQRSISHISQHSNPPNNHRRQINTRG